MRAHTTSIPTPASRRAVARRLDRANARPFAERERVDAVLRMMQHGASLHFVVKPAAQTGAWRLSTGQRVDDDVALLLVHHARVTSIGASVLDGAWTEAFRFTEF